MIKYETIKIFCERGCFLREKLTTTTDMANHPIGVKKEISTKGRMLPTAGLPSPGVKLKRLIIQWAKPARKIRPSPKRITIEFKLIFVRRGFLEGVVALLFRLVCSLIGPELFSIL